MLGKNWKDIEHSNEDGLKFEDNVLEYIYSITKRNQKTFPDLWNIVKDFYGDSKTLPEKLPHLIKEVEIFIEKNKTPEIFNESFIDLVNLCKKGINKRLTLYGIAD